jgi:hypothetical protein
MAAFAEYIAEHCHSELALIWKIASPAHAVASFEMRTLRVEVSFEQREANGAWHVAFTVTAGEPMRTAAAFRIFSGVFQAVREFVETREPEVAVFISKDEDVAGIYETCLRRERGAIEALGCVIEGPHRVDPYTEFRLPAECGLRVELRPVTHHRRLHPSSIMSL